jgi:hypothetical protein
VKDAPFRIDPVARPSLKVFGSAANSLAIRQLRYRPSHAIWLISGTGGSGRTSATMPRVIRKQPDFGGGLRLAKSSMDISVLVDRSKRPLQGADLTEDRLRLDRP